MLILCIVTVIWHPWVGLVFVRLFFFLFYRVSCDKSTSSTVFRLSKIFAKISLCILLLFFFLYYFRSGSIVIDFQKNFEFLYFQFSDFKIKTLMSPKDFVNSKINYEGDISVWVMLLGCILPTILINFV